MNYHGKELDPHQRQLGIATVKRGLDSDARLKELTLVQFISETTFGQ